VTVPGNVTGSTRTWETSQRRPHFRPVGCSPAPSWEAAQWTFSRRRLGCHTGRSVRNVTFRSRPSWQEPGRTRPTDPTRPPSGAERTRAHKRVRQIFPNSPVDGGSCTRARSARHMTPTPQFTAAGTIFVHPASRHAPSAHSDPPGDPIAWIFPVLGDVPVLCVIEAGSDHDRGPFVCGVGGAEGRDHVGAIGAHRRGMVDQQPADLSAQ